MLKKVFHRDVQGGCLSWMRSTIKHSYLSCQHGPVSAQPLCFVLCGTRSALTLKKAKKLRASSLFIDRPRKIDRMVEKKTSFLEIFV